MKIKVVGADTLPLRSVRVITAVCIPSCGILMPMAELPLNRVYSLTLPLISIVMESQSSGIGVVRM